MACARLLLLLRPCSRAQFMNVLRFIPFLRVCVCVFILTPVVRSIRGSECVSGPSLMTDRAKAIAPLSLHSVLSLLSVSRPSLHPVPSTCLKRNPLIMTGRGAVPGCFSFSHSAPSNPTQLVSFFCLSAVCTSFSFIFPFHIFPFFPPSRHESQIKGTL